MRAKTTAILHKITQLVASIGVGYALGRAHQSYRDNDTIAGYNEALKTGAATVRDTLRQREKDHDDGG